MGEASSLREICEEIVDCPHSTPVWTDTGVVVIRSHNIRGGRLILSDVSYTDEKHFRERTRRATPRPGDIVITREAPMGQVCMIPQGLKCCMGQRMVLLRPNQSRVNNEYLLYALQSRDVQNVIKMSEGTGATVSNLRIPLLEALLVPTPKLEKQSSIARILGALDDKIELNQKMNETLEAMTRAIFKSWFIDFDPVRAKAAGESPESICRRLHLTPDLLALFPDRLQDSELGAIPEGWRMTSLENVIEISDSKRIPLSHREREKRQGPYPYYGAASVMDHVDDFLFDGIYVLMGEDGSVINADGTPVLQYVWGKIWVNNHAHVLRGANGISTEHLLLHLKNCNIAAFVNGAVQPKLNQGNLNRIKFILPSPEIATALTKIIEHYFTNIRANADVSCALVTVRDALLPKLISGELLVPNAERILVRSA